MSQLFGLQCPRCKHVFPDGISMGVIEAHMETSHGAKDVTLVLVVLCNNHASPVAMDLVRTESTRKGERHHYACEKCKRSRVIKQNN